jgi:hypothetical protein
MIIMKKYLYDGLAVLAMTAAFPHSSHAAGGAAWNGNNILEECKVSTKDVKNQKQAMDYISCFRYVRGLGDGLISGGACLSPRITSQQLVEVAIKYLRAHPEKRHLDANNVLITAWSEAWPCKDAKADESPGFKP